VAEVVRSSARGLRGGRVDRSRDGYAAAMTNFRYLASEVVTTDDAVKTLAG
jgi:hypothetical protein